MDDASFPCEDCVDAVSCEDCGVLDHLLEVHHPTCYKNPLNRDDSPEAKGVISEEIDGSWGVIPESAKKMFSLDNSGKKE
jgi:hypothetical protein